ncbi:BZ3500_MvSof-1268-A1-R1_Chr1-3g01718 [Microbotryum saponariae]|uniref:BZ3500_MvSof-1268-A1-R1_Chr1-3g01718 protein n=1 Tax=Microbotryum saponariae TaxID=289078 RepID=A0A2X0MF93_9BASI|nr:BZ3500_MvSof-1268-A1-R1_Chr1-3g01718 [Microbotryum saponariae]SCZ94419.1 BZ3501_MvSof-1269-A2-R1_Chr1-3g01319 [Microbotryum saponariae]
MLMGSLDCLSHGLKLPATAQLVYCSGQIHSENGPGGTVVVQGSTADKTKMIIGNLEKVLKAGGSSLTQLVKVNIYITSFDFFGEMNEIYNELIPNPKPPRTCVCVKDLPFGAQIEIECTGWTED